MAAKTVERPLDCRRVVGEVIVDRDIRDGSSTLQPALDAGEVSQSSNRHVDRNAGVIRGSDCSDDVFEVV